MTLGVILAVAGQWTLTEVKSIPSAIVFYLVAVALVLAAPDDAASPISPLTDRPARRRQVQWQIAFIIASALCTALAFALNADASFQVEDIPEYQFTAAGVMAWFASVVFFLAAFWQP